MTREEEALRALEALVRRGMVRVLGQERPFLVFMTDAEGVYVQFYSDDGVLFLDVPGGSCGGNSLVWVSILSMIRQMGRAYQTDPLPPSLPGGAAMPHVSVALKDPEEGLGVLHRILSFHPLEWTVMIDETTPEDQ